jgi:hypothetical protein
MRGWVDLHVREKSPKLLCAEALTERTSSPSSISAVYEYAMPSSERRSAHARSTRCCRDLVRFRRKRATAMTLSTCTSQHGTARHSMGEGKRREGKSDSVHMPAVSASARPQKGAFEEAARWKSGQ